MSILKEEQITAAIREGVAVAMEELPNEVGKIHGEIEHKLKINETESTSYTVKIEVPLRVDINKRDIKPTGKLKWPRKDGEVVVKGRPIPIPDPNQPDLTAADGSDLPVFDATTEKPEE
jgi:hypothetical protein